MKRKFIETRIFSSSLKGYLKEDPELLMRIQALILMDPKAGDIIKGAGGCRKLRVPARDRGKSGSYRTIYYDLSKKGEVYLLLFYGKNKKESLSKDERAMIAKLIKKLV